MSNATLRKGLRCTYTRAMLYSHHNEGDDMRRGLCGTCKDPVTDIGDKRGAKWIHDHADQRCVGHMPYDNPRFAFHCGPICGFPHEVPFALEVLPV